MVSILITLGGSSVSFADSIQWQKANDLYAGKDYGQSIVAYERVLKQSPKDPSVHFNLGNAYYKEGQIGSSILHYETARRLDPRASDIRHNLKLAQVRVRLQVEDATPGLLKEALKVSRYFRKGELILWSLFCWMGFLGLSVSRLYKQWGWTLGLKRMVMILLILNLILLGLKLFDVRGQDALVMKPEAQVMYGPSDREKVAFRLTEGVPVKVVDQVRDWYRIVLSSGEIGWIQKKALGLIPVD